jgi:hypothetical protein
MCAIQDASFSFQRCLVSGNVADLGGAIYLEENAAMELQSTHVDNNTAHSFGGGVLLAGSFSVAHVNASVHNNAAPFGNNMIVRPTTIFTITNSTIEGFVSRLGTDAGHLNVTLLTFGDQDLPAEASPVHAILDGLVVAKDNTGPNGLVTMRVKIRKPPGTWCCLDLHVVNLLWLEYRPAVPWPLLYTCNCPIHRGLPALSQRNPSA